MGTANREIANSVLIGAWLTLSHIWPLWAFVVSLRVTRSWLMHRDRPGFNLS